MKPTRFLTVAFILLGMVATASALTPAGETISNQAFGNYKDAAGTSLTQVASNIVETVVAQVAGVANDGDQAATMSAMDSTVYTIEFQNTGNGDDDFTMSATSAVSGVGSGSYSTELFRDLDGDGSLSAAEIADGATWDKTTGTLEMDSTFTVFVRVIDTYSGGSSADNVHTVTLTGTSSFVETPSDLDVNASVVLVTTIAAAAINGETTIVGPDPFENPGPGDPITYESCFTNDGTEVGKNLVFTTVMPSNTTLDVASVSLDGGSNYVTVTVITSGSSTDAYVYNSTTRTLTVELGDLAVDATVCVTYTAIVDPNIPAGSPIDFPGDDPDLTYDNPDGDPYDPIHPVETGFPTGGPDVAQVYAVDVTQNGTADTTSIAGEPADTVRFAFTVTNNGNGTDNFTLSGLIENNGGDDDFFTEWIFYIDTDGDGVLDPSEEVPGNVVTETGNLGQGGDIDLIAVGVIPGGTPDADADGVSISATSVGDTGVSDAETITVTCEAPVIISGSGGLFKSVLPTGDQPPGTTLEYTITVLNSGSGTAEDVVITDDVPANTTLVLSTWTADNSGVVTHSTTGGANGNGTVTFTFATLGPGVTATMTFEVTID